MCLHHHYYCPDEHPHDPPTPLPPKMYVPAATRALLGALMDQMQRSTLVEPLYKSLNPFTKYKISGAEKALTNTKRWHIE